MQSDPRIEEALENWLLELERRGVWPWQSLAYCGGFGKLWNAFLQALIDHGGWTNVNDDRVRLHELQQHVEQQKKKNVQRQKRRADKRRQRQLKGQPITAEFEAALQAERDRRAAQLQKLRTAPNANRWLSALPAESCERIADVWQAREWMKRASNE